mmetsp:Transcript_24675/g.79795  ORF Transcript_24675/g.79795 Transcript_24675/m.79795 type:complete len:412 (-) Transcript_24675:332-1567(-)
MPPRREGRRAGQAGDARSDDGDLLGAVRRGQVEGRVRFVARARVHQARHRQELEGVVQARLVAGDAGIRRLLLADPGLRHEVGVREEGPGHRHEIRLPALHEGVSRRNVVHPVRRAQSDDGPFFFVVVRRPPPQGGGGKPMLELGSCKDEGSPGNAGGDRRHAGLVPADSRINHVDVQGFGELHRFFKGKPVLDELQQRQSEDEREGVLVLLLATSSSPDGSSRAFYDFQGEPRPIPSAPLVGAVVRLRRQELVDEVALGAHDFHAVVASLLGEEGGAREVVDRPVHVPRGHLLRREDIDRRLLRRRTHRQRVVRVPPGVEDLHGDLPASLVHRAGHRAVLRRFFRRRHLSGKRQHPALTVRRHAPRHDQTRTGRPLRVELRHRRHPIPLLLETRMHRPHHHAIPQLEATP